MRTLSVVVPAYNEEESIPSSLRAAYDEASAVFDVELIVVDDGSTDRTAAEAGAFLDGRKGRVVTQRNSGRFAARAAGLREATGEFVLFVDSRVRLEPGSLAFVARSLDGAEVAWNAHVDIEGTAPYVHFWRVVTELAFAAYFANPRTMSFGVDEFDRFPKGTTCFFVSASLAREAFSHHTSRYADSKHSNDDTPIIRWIAGRTPINISPSFRCSYRTRTSLRGFVRHAFHRGTVFYDGHVRRGARFMPLGVAALAGSVVAPFVAALHPRVAVVALATLPLVPAALAASRGRRGEELAAVAVLAPVYAAAHVAGMWRGVALALSARAARPADVRPSQ